MVFLSTFLRSFYIIKRIVKHMLISDLNNNNSKNISLNNNNSKNGMNKIYEIFSSLQFLIDFIK